MVSDCQTRYINIWLLRYAAAMKLLGMRCMRLRLIGDRVARVWQATGTSQILHK